MHNLLLSSLLITAASAAPYGPFNFFSSETPSNGANGNLGGLFGVPVPVPAVPTPVAYIINVLADYITFPDPNALAAYLNIDQILGYAFAKPSEYPRSQISVKDFYDPGTGPYPAHFFTDPGLPNHVIYAPKTPPPQELKMPTMVWGNGLCLSSGTAYGPFLMEIASHGYIVIATGPVGAPPPSVVLPSGILPGPNGEVRDPKEGQVLNGFSSVQDMLDSIKFVADGKLDRLGNVDKDSFITAGSSCGGLEAYSAAYKNDKVKLIGVYNSGTLLSGRQKYVKELKNRVAYISGGPEDVSWQNVSLIIS